MASKVNQQYRPVNECVGFQPGVFDAPPSGFQLATIAISSMPVSFGLSSSSDNLNSAACSRNHFAKACFGVSFVTSLTACHALPPAWAHSADDRG